MQKAIAFLTLVGLAQASSVRQKVQDMPVEDDDLYIKMPEAIVPDERPVNEALKVGLSLVQSESKLDMFNGGILHASLKPIVTAKVKKTMEYIRHTKNEYEQGNVHQRMAIQDKAQALALDGAGTRNYNQELCWQLWGEANSLASELSFYYCPEVSNSYPKILDDRIIVIFGPWGQEGQAQESRERSALLTQWFWNGCIWDKLSHGFDCEVWMDDNITFSMGQVQTVQGIDRVKDVLPYIGFPATTWLSTPAKWHCDLTSCIAPLNAWSSQSNYIYAKFCGKSDPVQCKKFGQVKEAIVPLFLWR